MFNIPESQRPWLYRLEFEDKKYEILQLSSEGVTLKKSNASSKMCVSFVLDQDKQLVERNIFSMRSGVKGKLVLQKPDMKESHHYTFEIEEVEEWETTYEWDLNKSTTMLVTFRLSKLGLNK